MGKLTAEDRLKVKKAVSRLGLTVDARFDAFHVGNLEEEGETISNLSEPKEIVLALTDFINRAVDQIDAHEDWSDDGGED